MRNAAQFEHSLWRNNRRPRSIVKGTVTRGLGLYTQMRVEMELGFQSFGGCNDWPRRIVWQRIWIVSFLLAKGGNAQK